jgi:hypothetical protein
MDLFIVKKHYQASDSDGYYYWAGKDNISFHSTNEKALAKIQTLLEEELIEFSKIKENNKHIPEESWKGQEELLKANKKSFSDGECKWSNNDHDSYYYDQQILPLFFVEKVEMD